MHQLKCSTGASRLLTLVFASMLLASIGLISHNASAMGIPPGYCSNEYDGPVTVAKINNGTQTFDPMANPGVTFQTGLHSSYYLLYIVHTPSVNRQGNSNLGTIWGNTNINNYYNGFCIGGAGPNQNHTSAGSIYVNSNCCYYSYHGGMQQVDWSAAMSGFSYNVDWMVNSTAGANSTTVPGVPTNLSTTPVSASQIDLMWNAPVNSSVTGYKIERSSDGTSWSAISEDTNSTVTMYFDSGLGPYASYYYRISAINHLGPSQPSGVVSATTFQYQPPPPSPNLSISSYHLNGKSIPDVLNVAVSYQDGSNNVTRTMPTTFADSLIPGKTYVVTPEDGGPFVFDHWNDTDSTVRDRTLVLQPNDTSLALVYRTADTPPTWVTLPLEIHEYPVAVDPDTDRIYVVSMGEDPTVNTGIVHVLDGKTYTILDTIPVGKASYGAAVNPNTDKIYVTNSNDNTVSIIDGATDTITDTITVGRSPLGVAVNPNTDKIYVTNSNNNTVSVIDGATDTITGTIAVGADPFGVAVDQNTGMVYVVNVSGNTVSVIDGTTNNVVKTIPGFNNPVGIAINQNTDKIYALNQGTVSVIDGSTNSVIQTITVGAYPGAIAANSNTGRVYAADEFGSISIIDGASNAVVNTVSEGHYPAGIGVNPNTGRVYFADYYYGNSDHGSVTIFQDNVTGTAAPTPTQNLQASAGDSQVFLSWSVPSSNGGSAITNYKIYRSTSSGTEALLATAGNVTSYTDNTVTDEQTYFYKVAAVNAAGESPQSSEASATPTAQSGLGSTSGITLNSVQSTSGTTDSSNQVTLSNFNATAGADRLLVVGISANNNNVESITFAGIQLTREVSHFTNNDAEFWYLTNPTGTGDITVTMNGPTQAVVGAYSFLGVNQTAPIPTHITRHNLAPSSPAISITTQYPNDWVLDLPSIYGGSTLGSPTCTQQWNANVPNAITGASSSAMVQSPATVTCKWTASSADLWDDVAVELRAD